MQLLGQPGPIRPSSRADLLDRLETVLGHGRLIALVGPPGIGKTWLAQRLRERRVSASLFVDLRTACTRADVHRLVAEALGVELPRQADDAVATHLAALIASRRIGLVVLDSVETAIQAVRASLACFLSATVNTAWLATSRTPIDFSSERCFPVEPLSLPAAPSLEAIVASESGALFVERAPQATADPGVLYQLLRRLGGVPLAIRVAAGRVDILPARDILAHFTEVVAVGAPLASAIETSWRLLDDDERTVWAQASVFESGFDCDAALAILRCDRPVIEVLSRLCRASLLESREGRFAMLPVLQAFASSKLDLGDVKERHACHFAATGRDLGNLLAVLARADAGEVDVAFAVPCGLAAGVTLLAQGNAREAQTVFDRALRHVAPGSAAAMLHRHRAECRFVLGDVAGAHRDLATAETLAAGDPETVGRVHLAIGLAARFALKLEVAEPYFSSALSLARRAEDRLRALLNLGVVRRRQMRVPESLALLGEAMALAQRHGLDAWEAELLVQQGLAEHQRGQTPMARALIETALRLCSPIAQVVYANGALGEVCLSAGDLASADQAARRALHLARWHGLVAFEADALGLIAIIADAAGQVSSAQGNFSLALAAARRAGSRERESTWSCALASLWARLGSQAIAARLVEGIDETSLHEEGVVLLRLARAQIQGDSLREVASAIRPHQTMAATLLRRALDGDGGGASLRIARDGSWFIPRGGGEPIHVGNRRQLSRVLKRLADGRVQTPGAIIASDVLFASGWPGEQIDERSARVRLYSTISSLRRLGLRDAIRRSQNGYRLAPDVPCTIVDDTCEPVAAPKSDISQIGSPSDGV